VTDAVVPGAVSSEKGAVKTASPLVRWFQPTRVPIWRKALATTIQSLKWLWRKRLGASVTPQKVGPL
jgi:hypothetical protein